MRLQSLLAACAASALLLPLAANAGNFPAGKEASYMTQCQDVASAKGVDAAMAKKHCECGAQAIKKNFTDKEIEDLDSKDGVDAKLMQKAQQVVEASCTRK
ncbi:hypothetical protein EON09_20120 [Pseudomonas soli]|uniref:Secreted protein n=1 Tax=Pseudomonas soli TaxID=1306993 RepID=A0AAJ5MHH0_9PSED|nr:MULTISPECIES: hypothetical protein [Pseudomonas]MDX2310359.1 hypothetical protein [Pseudomonas sp. On1]NBK40828.1 hypothetical protein [Pseudomonas soli]PYC35093.1 hypothetical protein DMX05_21460 [Pseudomonas soli]UXZ44388.1 hypothetical protein K7K07_20275 [Pseudomonas soli]WJO24152.1 hypothetical protein LU688_11460 [Pseudomonas soli]